MNASRILSSALVAVATLSAASAFAADDGGLPQVPVFVSTKTRAEVKAEYLEARANGTLPADNEAMSPVFNPPAAAARAHRSSRGATLASAPAGHPAVHD